MGRAKHCYRRSISCETALGSLPDRFFAEKYGVSITLISAIRREMKISASNKHYANGHRRKIDLITLKTKVVPLLGNFTDVSIARKFSVTKERIRQLRNMFDIPKFQKPSNGKAGN